MKWRWLLEELVHKKRWKATLMAFVLLVAFLVTIYEHKQDDITVLSLHENTMTSESISAGFNSPIINSPASIFIDVGGEVQYPGVVELETGARVYQAIAQAGGVTAAADLSPINQAMILSDGDKIYIPRYEETAQSQASAYKGASFITNSASGAGKININSASLEELQTLSGIGPVTAQKIIDYRSANGKFLELNHLMDVPGIGEKTFDALEDSICI